MGPPSAVPSTTRLRVCSRLSFVTSSILAKAKAVEMGSVADPWHFGVVPDTDPDPRIHASD
jgi:hypothetical protein